MMTNKQIKNLKVGSVVRDAYGHNEMVARMEQGIWILKWLHKDGTLSPGENWVVASQLKDEYRLAWWVRKNKNGGLD